jgi:hypothetical protein
MTRRFRPPVQGPPHRQQNPGDVLILAAAAFAFPQVFASEVLEGDTLDFDRWILQALRNPADPSVPAGPEWLRAADDRPHFPRRSDNTLAHRDIRRWVSACDQENMPTAAFVTVAVVSGAIMSTMPEARLLPAPARQLVATPGRRATPPAFRAVTAMNSAVTYLTLGTLLARTEKGPIGPNISFDNPRSFCTSRSASPESISACTGPVTSLPGGASAGSVGRALLAGRAQLAASQEDRAACHRGLIGPAKGPKSRRRDRPSEAMYSRSGTVWPFFRCALAETYKIITFVL